MALQTDQNNAIKGSVPHSKTQKCQVLKYIGTHAFCSRIIFATSDKKYCYRSRSDKDIELIIKYLMIR